MKIVRRNKYDLSRVLRENESIDVDVTDDAIVVNPENRDEVNDLVFLLSLVTVGSKDEISFDINDVAELEKNLLSKLTKAKMISIHPLSMKVKTKNNSIKKSIAINEVSVLRQSRQAAFLSIKVKSKFIIIIRLRPMI